MKTTREILRGGLAGAVGTLVMTLVIATRRALDLFWILPPKEIVGHAEREVGIRQELSRSAFDASWILAHLGYGVAAGGAFALLRRLLPRSTAVAGLLYGGALWAFGYLGLMPALGLYPWPEDDSPARMATMIVAHGVYGVTTAAAYSRFSNRAGRDHDRRRCDGQLRDVTRPGLLERRSHWTVLVGNGPPAVRR